jgi:hypothetical protein
MFYKMPKTTLLWCSIFFIVCNLLQAQQPKKNVVIQFSANVGNQPLQLNDTWYRFNNTTDSFFISSFKFYISGVQLLQNNTPVFTQKNSYHLINFADSKSCSFSLNIPTAIQYNKLQFFIGIDSITNKKGVLTGCLDPLQGMYWTWHSGFINMKLEGNSNICNTRNNTFQLHIGGYKFPYNTLQQIQLGISSNQSIAIVANLNKLLQAAILKASPLIMTPGKEAQQLSNQFGTIFSTQ